MTDQKQVLGSQSLYGQRRHTCNCTPAGKKLAASWLPLRGRNAAVGWHLILLVSMLFLNRFTSAHAIFQPIPVEFSNYRGGLRAMCVHDMFGDAMLDATASSTNIGAPRLQCSYSSCICAFKTCLRLPAAAAAAHTSDSSHSCNCRSMYPLGGFPTLWEMPSMVRSFFVMCDLSANAS